MARIYWFVAEVNPRNAGYRVRTLPIATELGAQGVDVQLRPLADLPALVPEIVKEGAAVIVSKPGDTLTHLCMRQIAAQRIPVIVDLFDNYFSWSPALEKKQLHWQWLRGLNDASLIMSSSPYLANVIRSLTDTSVVEVCDEVPRLHGGLDPAQFDAKWSAPDRLELLWFGIAGNPYFQAGLEDLVGWQGVVRGLAHRLAGRAEVRLTICTNQVPAVNPVLATFRAREIDARFVAWTEAGCEALIEASHVVLLPTNASGFSLAKTHNRCTDALLGGCLVLASPSGPYRGIDGAVIDDPELLTTVVSRTNAAGVRELIGRSFAELRRRHDLAGDVAGLRRAVDEARRQAARLPADGAGRSKVLVTARIRPDTPKFSRTLGYLVAGFANAPLSLNFDFKMEALEDSGGLPTVTLSDRGWQAVTVALGRNVDADHRDFEDRIECRLGDWRLRLVRESRQLVVEEGLGADLIARLHSAQIGGRGDSSSELASWFEPHIDVMTRLLAFVGLRELDFATEDEGGWQEFCASGDDRLQALQQRLQARWKQHQGNEDAWGRVEGATA